MKPYYKAPTPIDQAEIIPFPFQGTPDTCTTTLMVLEHLHKKDQHPRPSRTFNIVSGYLSARKEGAK